MKKFLFVFVSAMVFMTAAACGDISDTWLTGSALDTSGPRPDTRVDTDTGPRPDTGPPPFVCVFNAQCEDGDPCTTDTCVNGECGRADVICSDGFECNEVGKCVVEEQDCGPLDNNNPCTIDTCDAATGAVVHTQKSCDDGNDVTEDFCDASRPQGQECVYVANCWDDDACTVEVFRTSTGECEFLPRCGEGEYCTETGGCLRGCYDNEADCDDGNVCTADQCVGGSVDTLGYCDNTTPACPPDQVCHSGKPEGEQCLDMSPSCAGPAPEYDASCSELICLGSEWILIQTLYCESGTCQNGECFVQECEVDADCADNPCAIGTCQGGICQYAFDVCPEGQVCDATSGTCFTPSEDVCGSKDCDDGDEATLDYCDPITGECEHHQPIVCGEGTKLVEETGECVPVAAGECVPGDMACLTMGSQTHLAECVETGDEDNPTEWESFHKCGSGAEVGCVNGDPPFCIDL